MNTKYHQTEGFKFPAAGLIGLDAGTVKGISKFLRARERELNTIETEVITCEGGPFNGQKIELQPNGGLAAPAKSAEFTVGAWRGHYLGSSWVSTLEANAPAPEAMAAPLPRPKINCDLPAKGFDQLRDLLSEMSINPLKRETTIKTHYKTARFEYGKTDDFGNGIVEFSPVGAYACELVEFVTPTRSKKTKPAIVYKIKHSNAQHGAMAMDDFGDLFITQPRANEREEMTEKRQFVIYKIGRTTYTIPATIEAVERLAAKILKIKKWHSDKMHRMEADKILKPDNRFQTKSQPAAELLAPVSETAPRLTRSIFAGCYSQATTAFWLAQNDKNTMFSYTETRKIFPIKQLLAWEFDEDFIKKSTQNTTNPQSHVIKIEQPAKPLEVAKIDYSNAALSKEQLEGKIALFSKMRDEASATIKTSQLSATSKENLKLKVITRQLIIDEAQAELNSRNTPPALLPKIEQPAKPSFDYAKILEKTLQPRQPVSFLTPEQIAWMDQVDSLHNRVMAEQARIKNERIAQFMHDSAPPATTCNPDAARLRDKATICRAANRPTWAEKLEAQADALERVDPPKPPPCKHKNKMQRQRPRKTACILLAKIRHPARHFGSKILSQKYGEPFRQNFRDHPAEKLVSNSHEPPGIKLTNPPATKPVTPSGNFYQPEPRSNPCPAHNFNPATHQPHPNKSEPNAVIYPCPPPLKFAASMWPVGRLGKQADTACPPPFGGSSTSYWITQSCRTRTKPSQPRPENRGKHLDATV